MTNETKKRGRPPKNKTPNEALSQHMTDSLDDRNPNGETRPRKRWGRGSGGRLTVPQKYIKDSNFYYYWALDDIERPGKIDDLKDRGYELVVDENGSPIARKAGVNSHYLMRQKMEWHKEDLQDKRDKVKKRNEVESKLGENEYAPTEDGRPEGNSEMLRKQSVSTSAENPYAD